MMNITTTVPDIFKSSIVPVTEHVIYECLSDISLKKYFKSNVNIRSGGTNVSTSSVDGTNTPKTHENRADIDMTFSFASGDQQWDNIKSDDEHNHVMRQMTRNNRKVIFWDPTNKISIVEYEKPLTITMSVRLMFTEMVGAIDAIQKLQSAYSYGLIEHTFDHSYMLPEDIYIPLYLMYKLQGNEDASEFMSYLSTWSGNRIERIYNKHDKTDVALSVRRNRHGILSKIEFDQGAPEAIGNDKSADMFAISFTIKTQLSMSHNIGMEYPIVINNTMLPMEMLPIRSDTIHGAYDTSHPYYTIDLYRRLISNKNKYSVPEAPVHLPWYDDWLPREYNYPLGYKPFLIAVITLDDIDNESGVTQFNIETDLPIKPIAEVIEAIKLQGVEDSLYPRSNIHIALFRDDMLVDPSMLEMDDQLNFTIKNRDTSYIYRLVISSKELIEPSNVGINILNVDIIAKKK